MPDETVKITGIVCKTDGNDPRDVNLGITLPLRDLFAAFALVAVVGLNLEEATHESDAIYAYSAADAMMKERVREGKRE
jgi:hypothetical protein